jgi:tetratricopeptide (TPR) repeat protein
MAQWLTAMQKGQQKFQQGNFAEASHHFSSATKTDPKRPEGWANLGVSLVEMAEYHEAKTALQRAIEIAPNITVSYLALGDANRFLGLIEEALSAYQHAVGLQRSPMGLNKLACILRRVGKPQQADSLYREALQIAPNFTLASVNLATLQVELDKLDEAQKQLDRLSKITLSPEERAEVNTTRDALSVYQRLQDPIKIASTQHKLAPLEKALQSIPDQYLHVDDNIIAGIERYAESARKLSERSETVPSLSEPPPEDWPLIEGLFMIPFVETVDDYIRIKTRIEGGETLTGDLLESVNMERVVKAMRLVDYVSLEDPVKAETYFRYWHALSTLNVSDMQPGQFKVTQNMTNADITKRRAEPHLVTGTFRHFITEIYTTLPAGLYRGLVTMLAISDIHAFADGNGRLGGAWLNRELEAEGDFPIILTSELGNKGRFSAARREVRRNGGDLSPMVDVVIEAQQFSRTFCETLKNEIN